VLIRIIKLDTVEPDIMPTTTDPFDDYIARYSNWGRWGADDDVGTGREWLEDGYPITVEDLEATAEHEGAEIHDGDILLVRTGQLARCREQGWGTYAGGDAPGLSFFTIPWLAEKQIAAVASDTWGVEVRPNELSDSFQPFHIPALVYMGLLLGEMFDLEPLAAACADDGVCELLVSAPPLPFTGTAGAPPGPVAIR
jgi:kynurenine formamidase